MKRFLSVGLGLLLAGFSHGARAQVIQGVPVVEAMSAYAEPRGLVEVEPGRRIHMLCLGQGSPTVVATAGLGAWSGSWALVQPEVAKFTRACAWDRAGFGLSDGDAKHAQTVEQTAGDLEKALKAAGEKGPFVWVGHSAGAHEVLTLADRYPKDTAGIVLVDPVRPHDMAREAAAGPKAAAADRAYFASESKRLRDCAAGIEAGTVKTGAPAEPCFRYYPEIPSAVQTALARRDADSARLRAQASLYEEYEPNGERVAKAGRAYGDLPLIVLSAGKGAYWSDDAKDEHPALLADWTESHRELARLSRRGERRVAEGSGHLVQLEAPTAVIAAIRDVVTAARTKR